MEPLADRLPLVIGVTGHRDLRPQDRERLEQEVAAVIARLRRDYLRGGETPMILLSALAEGADRLVARVALVHGLKLVAPLPLPLDDYRRDFEPGLEPGNMAEFNRLFAQAIAAPVMPIDPDPALGLSEEDRRNLQYRAAGFFIAQHCDVLLALWDGDSTNASPGGTADVVKAKLEGFPIAVTGSARASLDGSEIGPVIHIVTPRQKEASPAHEVAVAPWGRAAIKRYRGGLLRRGLRTTLRMAARVFGRNLPQAPSGLTPDQRRQLEAWEAFDLLAGLTRDFNRETATLARMPDGAQRVATSVRYLFDDPDSGNLDQEAAKFATERVARRCRFYGIADTLAQSRQKRFRHDWILLLFLGFVAFCCFDLFSHLSGHPLPLLAVYSVCFVLIVTLILRARFGRHQERFLDYRAFAEALRVAVYWKLVGIDAGSASAPVASAPRDTKRRPWSKLVIADAYPIKQPGDLAWVKICLRTIELLDHDELQVPASDLATGRGIARRCWVDGQYAYYRRQGFRHDHRADVLETYSILLVALLPFALVPLLVMLKTIRASQGAAEEWDLPAWLAEWLPVQSLNLFDFALFIMGLLPGVAAVLTGYSERLALKAQARQYDRMRTLFERARDLFDRLPESGDVTQSSLAQALYAELGIEAMKETADWVAIYRQRPIQMLQ